jgi:hypothetical protein
VVHRRLHHLVDCNAAALTDNQNISWSMSQLVRRSCLCHTGSYTSRAMLVLLTHWHCPICCCDMHMRDRQWPWPGVPSRLSC